MSTYTAAQASPFTRAVVNSMRKLYPEALADKSFDNTGLLLEAPFDPTRRQRNSVLLTIDLTRAVADEAIARKDSVVVAYHPIIFRGLKSLTLADTQQQSLLRLASEGISVYSPHTAVDAAPGGLGDWLADIVTGTPIEGSLEQDTPVASIEDADGVDMSRTSSGNAEKAGSGSRSALQRQYSRPKYPRTGSKQPAKPPAKKDASPGSIPHTRSAIQPSPNPPESFEDAGIGRLVQFDEPQPLTHLIERIAKGMGTPAGFPVAIPQDRAVEDITIRSVAVCAGSGDGVFRGVDADLLFTGELSHHEALAANERGVCVVTLFHSNTERGFLRPVMKPRLESILGEEWARVRKEVKENLSKTKGSEQSALQDALGDETIEIECSERDRDPYGIVLLQDSEVPGTVLDSGEVQVQEEGWKKK